MAKHPGGRPKKIIDEKLLETMAMCHLTNEQIAQVVGVSIDTLKRRYAEKINECRSRGKAKLAIKAHQLAEKGSVPMLKYLLSNHMQWSERVTVDQNTDHSGEVVVYRSYNPADLKEK